MNTQENEVYELFISGSQETAFNLYISLESCVNPQMTFETFHIAMMNLKKFKTEIAVMHENSTTTL